MKLGVTTKCSQGRGCEIYYYFFIQTVLTCVDIFVMMDYENCMVFSVLENYSKIKFKKK